MIEIIVKTDNSTSMAHVYDNKGNSLEGNFWDFHNGCHGNYNLPEFNNLNEYIDVLKQLHHNDGNLVKIIRKSYKYKC